MTLVFAGFNKNIEKMIFSEEIMKEYEINTRSDAEEKVRVDGVYFAADSAITSGDKTMLNGFRKIYPVKVILWSPYIAGKKFRSYENEYFSFEVALAFAGNTLSAQHYMNVIIKHLSNLRVTMCDGYGDNKFQVIRDCEKNPLTSRNIEFSEDPFIGMDFRKFLTAEYISATVLHSLKFGVSSAKDYKLSDKDFDSLKVEMALAVQCQKSSNYHLYQYDMARVMRGGRWDIDISQREVGLDEVAVLGLKKKYESLANAEQMKISSENGARPNRMFQYLNECIDIENKDGSKGVAKPSSLKIYQNGKLKFIESQK